MNHQIQGLVLVNNEWVSRPLDVYQIMARAQQDDIEMQEPILKPAAHSSVPGYGILSRTVLSSPLFKLILPANIRHEHLNDIALVGEDSIHLYEIREYGRLHHAAVKSNLSGRILTARVFGDPREVSVTKSPGSPLPRKQTVQRSRQTNKDVEGLDLPPEVLVLTLTSRTLMFLWAQPCATGRPVFQQKIVRLPAGSSRFDRLGQYLAIDPKRRAIAVAAYEGRFMLYKTKSMQAWRDELRGGADTMPIEDERMIPIKGRVMHMEFLASASGKDDYHVVLLFIVVHKGLTRITCFDWDCRCDLSAAAPRTERVSVDLDDQDPSLLIPLSRSPDFLLICDTHVSVYKDVLSGAPQRNEIPIPDHILQSLRPGDSTNRPQWVQWDKTPRNPDFPKETFYVAREDGRVMYIEQGPADAMEMDDAGDWPYQIDKAFACLSVDNSEYSQSYPDVLMAGAAGNDGLLCKVGAWPLEYSYTTSYPAMNQFTYVESMPNWSPLTGLCVTDLPGIRNPYERERSAIYVTNGVTPHGQVSELRQGLHALIDGSFSGMNGCTGLWVVDSGSQTVELDGKSARQHYALVIATLPLETLLLRLVRTQPESRGEYSGAWEDGVWDVTQLPNEDEPTANGITRNEETIAACILSDRLSIQITRKDARLFNPFTLSLSDKIQFRSPILLAASTMGQPHIVVGFKGDGKTCLEVIPILNDGTFEKSGQNYSRHVLSADPTCIELLEIAGQSYVFVGTLDSKVILLRIEPGYELSKTFESTLNASTVERSRTICEGAVLLTSDRNQALACVTRDGLLFSRCARTLDISFSEHSGALSEGNRTPERLGWNINRMGSTSARIYASSTDGAAAFVSCGPDFCRVRLSKNKASVLDVESIWFTNRTNPGYLQNSITATHQLRPVQGSGFTMERNLGGFLFLVSGDQMLYTQLDADVGRNGPADSLQFECEPRTIPRKLIIGAKPTLVAYLTLPRKMLVATTEATEGTDVYQPMHSTLRLLKVHDDSPLDEAEVKQETGVELTDRLIVAQYVLNHAERVYSIADWPFEDDRGKKYNLVIVGTGMEEGTSNQSGRRLIFNLGQRGSRLSLQKESTYPGPVYSIAMFDKRATVSIVGKLLHFDEFDVGLGRWFNRGIKELPSLGIHVTVSGPNVYVSTLQHSHLCFKIIRGSEDSRVDIKQVFTDSRERSCTHHLTLRNGDLQGDLSVKEESLILLTDKKTGTVSGLYSSGDNTFKQAATNLFEASLPQTVIRLQRGNIRPPWRRPSRFDKHHDKVTGILVDDIIGACSDGTIYAFSVLTKPARQVLRLLQNLIEIKQSRDPANQHILIRHRSGDIFDILMNGQEGAQDCVIRARDIDPRNKERGAAGPKHNHLDGDLLLRFFEEGGDLEEILSGDTNEDVPALFMELCRALFPEGSYYLRSGRIELVDVLAGVREWIDELLMPLL